MNIEEFHCIQAIENIPSILAHGILSHEKAESLKHRSVAMAVVQERRDKVRIPRGLRLHQYANLYFHARNPMMYRLQDLASQLCVLRVSSTALQTPGAVIADQNASSDWVRFLDPSQIAQLDLEAVFARDWRDDHLPSYWRKKSQKCAELLIPKSLPPELLSGAYVVSDAEKASLRSAGFSLPIDIDSDLFFR